MSKASALHTVEDLESLAQASLTERETAELLTRKKQGLQPVQLAALLSAVNSIRILEALQIEQPTATEETQADRIEALLEALVVGLEAQSSRLSGIELALAKLSGAAAKPIRVA
jgi:hypothetical protein